MLICFSYLCARLLADEPYQFRLLPAIMNAPPSCITKTNAHYRLERIELEYSEARRLLWLPRMSRTIPKLHFCLTAKEYVSIALHMYDCEVNGRYINTLILVAFIFFGPAPFPHLLSTTNYRVSQAVVHLGWVDCLPNSSLADRKMTDVAGHLGQMVGLSNQSQRNPARSMTTWDALYTDDADSTQSAR